MRMPLRPFTVIACLVISIGACTEKSQTGGPKAEPLPKGTTFETIEEPSKGGTQDTGYWPNLLVDKDGTLTVAYCDANLGDAKVARRGKDGKWAIETVESKGAVGKYMAALVGPAGLELIYFDQSRKTLRYAAQSEKGWQFQDVTSDKEDLGISGRFILGPKGERLFVYYNTRNELILSKGDTKDGALAWTTQKLATAGGVYNIQLDMGVDKAGRVLIAYPDWAVSRSTLYQGLIQNLLHSKLEEELQFRKVDEEGIAGLKSAFVFLPGNYEIVYMSSRGGMLYSAKLVNNEFVRTQLFANIANFAAKGFSDGRLVLALQVGKAEGLGEGALHLAVRDPSGAMKEHVIDSARPVGQYLSVAEVNREIAIAYYDGVKKALRVARIP